MSPQPYNAASFHIRSRPTLSGRVQRVWMGYVAFIISFAVVFGLWQAEPVPDGVHLLGVAIAAMCVLPLALWVARGTRELPMFELICVAYLLAFSLPIYLLPNEIIIRSQARPFSSDEMIGALFLVLLGVSMMICGYYTLRLMPVVASLPRWDLPLRPHWRSRYLIMAFTVGLGVAVLSGMGISAAGSEAGALIRPLANQAYIGIALLAYQVFREPSRLGTITLYSLVFLCSLFGLTTGMLENALVPFVLIFIVRWHVSRKLPVRWLLAGAIIFIVLNSAKMGYRERVWNGGENLRIGDKISLWLNLGLLSAGEARESESTRGEQFRRTMSRFDLLHQFQWLRAATPSSIPFYNGKTYEYMLYGWIPRVFWPNKPTAQEGNISFVLDYDLLSLEQTSTTMIGIGHLPEAYANFGTLGVVMAMFLQGVFFAAINQIMNGPNSEGGRAIYLSVMIFFLNGIGTNTATMFMSVIPNIIAGALILRLFSTHWRYRQPISANQPVWTAQSSRSKVSWPVAGRTSER